MGETGIARCGLPVNPGQGGPPVEAGDTHEGDEGGDQGEAEDHEPHLTPGRGEIEPQAGPGQGEEDEDHGEAAP